MITANRFAMSSGTVAVLGLGSWIRGKRPLVAELEARVPGRVDILAIDFGEIAAPVAAAHVFPQVFRERDVARICRIIFAKAKQPVHVELPGITPAELEAMIARWLEPADAQLEGELDEIFGCSARKEREARLVAYLNRRFVRPLFGFPSHE